MVGPTHLKNISQIGNHSPNFQGESETYLKSPPSDSVEDFIATKFNRHGWLFQHFSTIFAGGNKVYTGLFWELFQTSFRALIFLPVLLVVGSLFPCLHNMKTREPQKKASYFPLYWLFNSDPDFMVYEIIPT